MDFKAVIAAHRRLDAPMDLAHHDHDPTLISPMHKLDNDMTVEFLRNYDLASVEQVGKMYIYRTTTGHMFTTFLPPEDIQYSHGM